MNETQQVDKKTALKDVEAIRDLFARAHDYIAQANHPGHLGMKVAEVLNFLAFQYNDFKLRGENLVKAIKNEAKAELSNVDAKAAKDITEAVLMDNAKRSTQETQIMPEQPNA